MQEGAWSIPEYTHAQTLGGKREMGRETVVFIILLIVVVVWVRFVVGGNW